MTLDCEKYHESFVGKRICEIVDHVENWDDAYYAILTFNSMMGEAFDFSEDEFSELTKELDRFYRHFKTKLKQLQ